MYIGRIIPELVDNSLPGKIDQIDSEMALLRAKFTDQDNSIRRLVEERQLLVEAFNNRSMDICTLKKQTHKHS